LLKINLVKGTSALFHGKKRDKFTKRKERKNQNDKEQEAEVDLLKTLFLV